MSRAADFVPQAIKMLTGLKSWLVEAEEYAEERGFEVNNLVQSRLSPDKFALVRQVQSACDTAKMTVGRLSGQDVPKHADEESTVDELKARIDKTIAILEGFSAADFEGSDERELTLSFLGGARVNGGDYVREFAIPNFYFHVTMAYAFLRHNGVKLGKRRFLGSLPQMPPAE